MLRRSLPIGPADACVIFLYKTISLNIKKYREEFVCSIVQTKCYLTIKLQARNFYARVNYHFIEIESE